MKYDRKGDVLTVTPESREEHAWLAERFQHIGTFEYVSMAIPPGVDKSKSANDVMNEWHLRTRK